MVDWFSFIGSIIGVSLIARELGADHKGQLLSAAFCATIPMANLVADLVVAHYRLAERDRRSRLRVDVDRHILLDYASGTSRHKLICRRPRRAGPRDRRSSVRCQDR